MCNIFRLYVYELILSSGGGDGGGDVGEQSQDVEMISSKKLGQSSAVSATRRRPSETPLHQTTSAKQQVCLKRHWDNFQPCAK